MQQRDGQGIAYDEERGGKGADVPRVGEQGPCTGGRQEDSRTDCVLPLLTQEEILGAQPLVFRPDGVADDFDLGGLLAEVGDGGGARHCASGSCRGGGGGEGGSTPMGRRAGVAGGAVFICQEGGSGRDTSVRWNIERTGHKRMKPGGTSTAGRRMGHTGTQE